MSRGALAASAPPLGAGAGELVSEGPGGALGAQGWWQRGSSPPEMYSSSSLRCGERGSERREQQH